MRRTMVRDRDMQARGHHETSDCFENPWQENIYSNPSTPKILAKISCLIKNFKPEKILQSSLLLEIRSTLPGKITITLFNS